MMRLSMIAAPSTVSNEQALCLMIYMVIIRLYLSVSDPPVLLSPA